jgi:hypothetical protein
VSREIEDDRDVASLTGEASTGTAAENGCVISATDGECSGDVCVVDGEDNSEWHLAIVRGIGAVRGPCASVKTNFTPHYFLQRHFKMPPGKFIDVCAVDVVPRFNDSLGNSDGNGWGLGPS